MLEASLTTLFNLEAAAEQPAARISLPVARRSARIRRYWHRTLVLATPVMAAAAVGAIVAGTTLLTSGPAARLNKTGPAPPQVAALGPGFDPMRVYASFGWLPAGTSLVSGETSRTEDIVVAQGGLTLSLLVHQLGVCWLQPVSAGSGATVLHCMDISPAGGSAPRVTGRAPDIGGHPAYWAINNAGPVLIWAYSARSWAELRYFSSCSPAQLRRSAEVPQSGKDGARCIKPAELVEVARHARVGSPVGSLVFPAVLTQVPKDWQVATAGFAVQDGYLVTYGIQVTAGPNAMALGGIRPPDNTPSLFAVPVAEEKQVTDAYCHGYDSFPGDRHPHHEVINGYPVLAGLVRAPYSPTYQACSPDAGGLLVFVQQTGAHPKLSVTALFSRLRLLGTDPADWTSKPLG